MPYCTITDVLEKMGKKDLSELSSREKGGIVNEAYVEKLITEKSGYIDKYVSGRYSLPLTDPDPTLRDICVDLVRLVLYGNMRSAMTLEEQGMIRDEVNRQLKDIQQGNMTLVIGTKAENRPGVMKSNTRTKQYTDDLLDCMP